VTPPLGGMAFKAKLAVVWDAAKQGCLVGLFAVPANVPKDAYCKYSFTLSIPNQPPGHAGCTTTSPVLPGDRGYGYRDFFDLGTMAGGWDEAAWAAKGLPTSGQLAITLTIHGVGHSASSAACTILL